MLYPEAHVIRHWFNSRDLLVPIYNSSPYPSSVQLLSHVWLYETYGLQLARPPCPSPTPGKSAFSQIHSKCVRFSLFLLSLPQSKSPLSLTWAFYYCSRFRRLSRKDSACQWEMRVQSPGREDPLEREMAAHSSILAWESHGQRSLKGYSPQGHKESDVTQWLNMPAHTHARIQRILLSNN